MPLITELTPTDQVILNDAHLGIVEFYLPNCRACKGFTGTYEALAETNPDVSFYKMDVTHRDSDNPSTSELWHISAVPTLLVFDEKIAPENELGIIKGNKSQATIQTKLDAYKHSMMQKHYV